MAIPKYEEIMLPLLKTMGDGKERSVSEMTSLMTDQFNLTEEERAERVPSNTKTVINNRVGWTVTYLKQSGLLRNTRWGHYEISDRGQKLLKTNPEKIDNTVLAQFKEFRDFKNRSADKEVESLGEDTGDSDTPEEQIGRAMKKLKTTLAQEILDKLRDTDPIRFENIVCELLDKMGYGSVEVTKAVGDNGIDGIVNQDELGLDKIYMQAKRYKEANKVSSKEVRDFIGTLSIHRSEKGIFVTTSDFQNNASDYVRDSGKSIVLINGQQLAELMIDYGVGVTTAQSHKISKLDEDYFIS